jgi:hypothetical protein
MTTIKATCPICGDVDLTPRDVTLTVTEPTGSAQYSFTCPTCTDAVRKPADEDVVALLASAGVRITRTYVPAEALETHEGRPLTYDDLLDFALWLEQAPDPLATLTNA